METQLLLMGMQDKLPKDIATLNVLRQKLDSLSPQAREEIGQELVALKLKSPAFVFWVGSFVFGNLGVGRFMIGDSLLGALRLLLLILYFVFYFICYGSMMDGEMPSDGMLAAVFILWIGNFAWWVVDLFIVGKKLRLKNLEKVFQLIETKDKQ